MSNLMHKVKDVVTGHNEHKGSSHGSSASNKQYDQGNSSTMNSDSYATHDSRMGNTDNTYAPDNMGTSTNTTGNPGNYGSGGYISGNHHDSRMTDSMRDTGNTYGSNTKTTSGTGGYDSGAYHDTTKDTTGFASTNNPSGTYDSTARTGNSNTYNSSPAGGYGSSNMNTSQTGAYTSDYGAPGNDTNLGGSHKYNTRSNVGSNMSNQVEPRGDSDLNNRTGQQGFDGTAAAAGGSSYNTQDSSKRRSSGPHSSNLLNKLDPRVKSSDYESNTASGQQRGW